MSEQRAEVQSAIHNHTTKQCRKLLPTQAALKNGLDAISRKKAPEQNENLWLLASKQLKPNNMKKRRVSSYEFRSTQSESFFFSFTGAVLLQ
jgi:hypothetical protein